MAECLQAVAVSEHLSESEPELPFFVVVGDAFDLGHEHAAVRFPSEVEVRLLRPARARFDSCVVQHASELVLRIGVPLEAALDQRRIDAKRLALTGEAAHAGFSIRLAECRGCRSWRMSASWRLLRTPPLWPAAGKRLRALPAACSDRAASGEAPFRPRRRRGSRGCPGGPLSAHRARRGRRPRPRAARPRVTGCSSGNGPSRSSHHPGWARATCRRRRVSPRWDSQTVGASVTAPVARDQATIARSLRL